LVAEGVDGGVSLGGQGVVGCDGDDEWLGVEELRGQGRRERLGAEADDPRVDLPVGDGVDELGVLVAAEADLDGRVCAAELAEGVAEAVVYRAGDADAEPAVEDAAQGGDGLAASFGGGQCGAGVGEEGLACGGQGRLAAVAVEERFAELALEAADLGADRGLGDEEALGGAGELPLVGDRDEGSELAEIHTIRFW
jgi:hypothetical protein